MKKKKRAFKVGDKVKTLRNFSANGIVISIESKIMAIHWDFNAEWNHSHYLLNDKYIYHATKLEQVLC